MNNSLRLDKYQQKLKEAILGKSSFMNTTKWKSLFLTLKEINIGFELKIKLLLDDSVRDFTIPVLELNTENEYFEEYWGVYELKEIEWLLITPKTKNQNTELETRFLQISKQFDYEVIKSGIKIYGYR